MVVTLPVVDKELGERIREIRGRLTQVEFAKKIGSAQFMISLYEKGKVKPPWKLLLKIASYGNVSVDYLLTGKHPSGETAYYSEEEREYIKKLVDIFRCKDQNAKKMIQNQIDTCHKIYLKTGRKDL